jgi:hypothetical protein
MNLAERQVGVHSGGELSWLFNGVVDVGGLRASAENRRLTEAEGNLLRVIAGDVRGVHWRNL